MSLEIKTDEYTNAYINNKSGEKSRSQPPLRRLSKPRRRLGHGPRRAAVLPVRFRVGAGVESRRRVDAEQLLER